MACGTSPFLTLFSRREYFEQMTMLSRQILAVLLSVHRVHQQSDVNEQHTPRCA